MIPANCSCGATIDEESVALIHGMAGHEFIEGCGRKIGPFPCCSVVQGDCLELMKQLPDGCVDAVITDPPYGIDKRTGPAQDRRHYGSLSNAAKGNDFPPVHGDSTPFDPSPWLTFPRVVLFGANYFANSLPPSTSWIVWDKRCGVCESNMFADCEMAWTNDTQPTRIVRHFWMGMLRESERGEPRVHPTQKPVAVMEWVISNYCKHGVILDPFAGSGTTLVAAKKLGRHFLGFEISPEYCAIARRRLAEIDAQPTLFEPKPEQQALNL